jgi:hypothetical protein
LVRIAALCCRKRIKPSFGKVSCCCHARHCPHFEGFPRSFLVALDSVAADKESYARLAIFPSANEYDLLQLETRNNRDFGDALIRAVFDEVSGAI